MKAAVLIALLLLAPSAWADRVPGPPKDCPAGAVGETSHNGVWCQPTTCEGDGDCGRFNYDRRPRVCQARGLCLEDKATENFRNEGQTFTRTYAHRACSADSDCAVGKCVTAKRCVLTEEAAQPTPAAPASAPASDTPKPRSGCAGGAEAELLGLLVLLVRRFTNARS